MRDIDAQDARQAGKRHPHADAHIGVVPEQRGRGYVNDLLAEATADAADRGFTSIISDTDVLNAPMIAAFERAGHREGVRPWHVWHYRYPPPAD